MTAPRDVDRIVRVFLDDGPAVLSNRVIESVLDEVQRTHQRTVRGPWRILPMSRASLLTAAAIAVVVVGGLAWFSTHPAKPVVGSPTPTPPSASVGQSVTPTQVSPSAPALESAPPLDPAVPIDQARALTAGDLYRVPSFATAIHFTQPATSVSPLGAAEGISVDVNSPTLFRVWHPGSWAVTFIDGDPLRADLCHPERGQSAGAFTTTDAVGAWLASATGMTVSAPIRLAVDGRAAVAWDVTLGSSCWGGNAAPPGNGLYFSAGEQHRVYALPTGTAIVLVYTWNNGVDIHAPIAAVNRFADRLVGSVQLH